MKNILPVYRKVCLTVSKAQGKYIWDKTGKRYLDFISGISVNVLGHRPPAVVKAVKEQLGKYLHVSNLYTDMSQEKYADLLIKKTFPGKVFFSNSGGEANELAIKLVRKAGEGKKKFRIISFANSFHGRSMSTLSATGQKKFHKGFRPLLTGFDYAKLNDISSVKKLIGPKTAAVLVEPIQGEGGVYPADKRFLQELKKLCVKYKLILIFDEIQTGFGRTGSLFSFQKSGVRPQILTLAKAAGGGLPLGITILDNALVKYFPYGSHGSTFGGNPLAVAAGFATLQSIDAKMLKRINALGDFLRKSLTELAGRFDVIRQIRGDGLMIGVEFKEAVAGEIVAYLFKKGILINACKENILRFLPPFIIDRSDIKFVINGIAEFLEERRGNT
ncbi:acetylornithine/succinylornithine family transaminase [bacterium]|nr:acetylornithine/succinylornithine family transaminase [bacterium]MBU4134749.1 acetylornithine/succinylornithine family transaminase [bacterium]